MTYFFDKSEYCKWARLQFQCNWVGFHGAPHWARVYHIGQHLGRQEGARLDVLELFAFLHDHRRTHEGPDVYHGMEAAESALLLRGKFFQIDDEGFNDLAYAMIYHSDGETEYNRTVQCCWDSDRLDLGRVGIVPLPQFLCTETAKNPHYIQKCVNASEAWFESFKKNPVYSR